jgi:hypothetical protein
MRVACSPFTGSVLSVHDDQPSADPALPITAGVREEEAVALLRLFYAQVTPGRANSILAARANNRLEMMGDCGRPISELGRRRVWPQYDAAIRRVAAPLCRQAGRGEWARLKVREGIFSMFRRPRAPVSHLSLYTHTA